MKNSSAYALPNPNRVVTGVTMPVLGVCGSYAKSFVTGAVKLIGAMLLSTAGATLAGAVCGGLIDLLNDPLTAAFGAPDCIIVSMTLWFMVIPAAFGLLFGGCKSVMRGVYVWYMVPAL